MSTFASLFLALAAAPWAQGAPHIFPRGLNGTNSTAGSDTGYSLLADYSGSDFFNHFTAFDGPDPTQGFVQYQTFQAAAQQKLVGFIYDNETQTTSAKIGVDSTSRDPSGRRSVRLTSKQTFIAGSMAVIDLKRIPVQYGLWPAIWMLGSEGTWPASGESDILEYVHKGDYNSATLHTAPGCTVDNGTDFQGRLLHGNCNAGQAGTGCSIAAYDQNKLAGSQASMPTAGDAFNKQGGGVYVYDWQADGITIWLFPHDGLPADLQAGKPNPKTWTQKPLARFSGAGCDFSQAFRSMNLVIDITTCGSWAGKADVWQSSGAANATGCATCDEWVQNNPQAFEEAYFDIASVKFYSSNQQVPGTYTPSSK
ncbi:glycoside hydrolase family 16 [Lecanosticta acicola]|uniref:Glycoside hydrolase family 16 n=1 Tax=Lecanosticta acicola TaxID=111012 RepID=A0AAI8Z6Z4_9PEZI|nr:glycoside hydrolase family 16 [Lecanosticta acicola]